MAANVVMISTTAVPDRVRGALSRWMIELTAGVYVGTMSARVRDELWSAVSDSIGDGAAVCVHPDGNEQGFIVRTAGERRRKVVDFDGPHLVQLSAFEEEGQPPPLPKGVTRRRRLAKPRIVNCGPHARGAVSGQTRSPGPPLTQEGGRQ